MTELETAKERIADLLSSSLDGQIHENMETYLSDIQNDYEEFYANLPGTDGWKAKYDELKEKYINRFMGDSTGTSQDSIAETSGDETSGAESDPPDETSVTYDDIFEEEEK